MSTGITHAAGKYLLERCILEEGVVLEEMIEEEYLWKFDLETHVYFMLAMMIEEKDLVLKGTTNFKLRGALIGKTMRYDRLRIDPTWIKELLDTFYEMFGFEREQEVFED